MIKTSWCNLGFNVTLDIVSPIENNDYFAQTDSVPPDVCDDLFIESIQRGKFEVLALDLTAYSADAYSMLAGFAKPLAGMALNLRTVTDEETGRSQVVFEQQASRCGYDNEEYNMLMEAVYFIPYFASLKDTSAEFLGDGFYTADEWKTMYGKLKAVYSKYGVTPSKDPDDWTEQKSKLLHAAEKLLINDMALVPIVFNQNAVLASKDLKKIDANYYSPMVFTKLQLKNYTDLTYTVITRNDKGEILSEEIVSIFEEFPTIEWDKAGTTIEKQQEQ
jgi:ABC-type oligopeptide transport system substrate-binding subunit